MTVMARSWRIGIVSDIHFASEAERKRGSDYEYRMVENVITRTVLRAYRETIWLKRPMTHNHLLDQFLEKIGPVDHLVSLGDYTCDSAYTGLSDDAAFQSACECVGRLRGVCDGRLLPVFGDHELGKFALAVRRGGMRLKSWQRATVDLGLAPFWKMELGNRILMGIVSSLVALPEFEPDMLPQERAQWEELRRIHMEGIRQAFLGLKPEQRVLLFCHDPTALPFLMEEEAVRSRLGQVEQTMIGHLHSDLYLRQSWIMSGMPEIAFLGQTVKRYSRALKRARQWKPFHPRLCPALSGIELLKDGGYYTVEISEDAGVPLQFHRHFIKR